MERGSFVRAGGFNPELISNEDCEFSAKARARGISIRAVPELAVTHLGAEKDLMQFVKRQFWHGSNVLNRRALRNNIRAIGLAAYMLGCMIWFFVAGLLEQSVMFPLAAAVLPASALATLAVVRHSRPVDLPVLFVLVLLYGFARAFALPVALIRLGKSFHGKELI